MKEGTAWLGSYFRSSYAVHRRRSSLMIFIPCKFIITQESKMRNRIKECRVAYGLRQRDLGDIIGVTQAAIARWETGVSDPSPAQQQDIAFALNTSLSTLFPGYEVAEPFVVKNGGLSTLGKMHKAARIKLGEKMMVRLRCVASEGDAFVPATVVQIAAHWFRVRVDKSGYSACFHYHAFLNENDIRRA